MAPSKKVLATVSRGQLPSFCKIGRGGCNSLAFVFTAGSYDKKKATTINENSKCTIVGKNLVPWVSGMMP